MKIAVLLTFDQSLIKWKSNGHFDREIFYYKKLYEKYKIKTTFISYGPKSEKKLISQYNFLKIISLSNKIKFSNFFFIRFFQSLFLYFFIKKDLKNIKVIKTNQLWGSWVLFLFKIFSEKFFLIRCGYEPNQNLKNENGFFFFKIFSYIYSYISYKISDQIIVTTSEIKEYIIKKFYLKKKIHILPNYINTQKFRPLNIKKNKNKILFVGRYSKEKNIDYLLNSIRELPVSLDIIGPGYNKKQISTLEKKYKIKINYLGILSNSKMPRSYNKYDIYVSTSNYEGNPKTILEAMSCGCTVIARNVQGCNTIISNCDNGYLVKKQSQLRKIISNIILKKNHQKNSKIKRNAINTIKKYYNLNIILTKEYKILKNLYAKKNNNNVFS